MIRHIIFMALIFLPSALQAEELEVVGDRPDFTESSATISTGHLQAELGVEVAGADDDLGIGIPKLLLRYGVLDDLELRLEVPDLVIGIPKSGSTQVDAGGIAAGLKWVHPLGDKAAAGLIFMAGSPVTTSNYDTEGFSTSVTGVWGVELTNRLSLDGNLVVGLDGLGIKQSSDASVFSFTASLALGIGMTDTLGMFLETFHTLTDRADYTPNADAGFTFLVTPRLQLDVYGGADVSDPKGGWFVGSGAVALF